MRALCVSVHDVAPATWPSCQRVLAAVAEVADIPLTLLVVPAYHGQCSAMAEGFEDAMTAQLERGHELALHGYFHRDLGTPGSALDWVRRRVLTAAEGEFAALTEQEAAERLLLGQRWFRSNGWPLAGFVPPAWLLGAESWKALRRCTGFEYVTTFTHLHAMQARRRLAAPCLTFSVRTPWRRAAAFAWAHAACRGSQAAVIRLALHPHDADYPALRRAWQSRLAELLRDRRALTKAEFVRTSTADGWVHEPNRVSAPARQAAVSG